MGLFDDAVTGAKSGYNNVEGGAPGTAGGVAGALTGILGRYAMAPIESLQKLGSSMQSAYEGKGYNPDEVTAALMDVGMLSSPASSALMPVGSLGMFGGKMAKTADINAMRQAEKLLAEAANPKQVFKDTGWFKAPDGQMRFEIDDSGVSAAFGGMGQPIPDTSAYVAKMGDALQHEGLFNEYPHLRYTDLEANPQASSLGAYDAVSAGNPLIQVMTDVETNRNWLRGAKENVPEFARMDFEAGDFPSLNEAVQYHQNDMLKDSRYGDLGETGVSTTLHELQHAIQEREGFARGGSPSEFGQVDEAKLARDAMRFRREMDRFPKGMNTIAKEAAVIKDYQEMGAMDWLPSRDARDIARDRFNNPDEQLTELIQAYGLDKHTSADPRKLYERLHGEAEAREVQKRMNMSADERRNTYPEYAKRDDLIIKRDGGPAMSIDETLSQFGPVENYLPLGNPERLANFEKWARNSVLLDETGRPAMFGSGTSKPDFNAFDVKFSGSNTGNADAVGFPAWLTDEMKVASEYANGGILPEVFQQIVNDGQFTEGMYPRVIPGNIRAENPLIYDAKFKSYDKGLFDELAQEARKPEYDALLVNNVRDGQFSDTPGNVIAIKDPNQFKSLWNNGEYGKTNNFMKSDVPYIPHEKRDDTITSKQFFDMFSKGLAL